MNFRIKLIILIIIYIFMPYAHTYCSKIDTYKKVGLTNSEIEFLKNNNSFTFSIESDYMPIEYADHNKLPRGFGIEYLNQAEKLLHINFTPAEKYYNYSWTESLQALKNGKIDILPTVSITADRLEYIYFTQSYLTSNILVIGNNDERIILKEKDLEGSTIVLPKKYWQNEYIKPFLKNYKIINTKNTLETLKLINTKKGDYTFLEGTVYNYYLQQEKLSNLKIVGEFDMEVSHCIGVSKKNKFLRDILNKVIYYIPQQKVFSNAIYINKKSQANNPVILVIILILIVLVLYLLRQVIKARRYKIKVKKNRRSVIENLSHDLKNPLATLKVNLSLIKNNYIKEEEKYKYFNIMDKNINNLNTIIEELNNTVKIKDYITNLQFAHVNIYDLLTQIYNENVSLFSKQSKILKLSKNYMDKNLKIKIDKERIHRAISNLVSNSLKFTDQNDETILNCKIEKSNLIISVCDNGIGIEKDDLNKVFDRFYKTENSKDAKGLGLSIAKEIINLHKGEIIVKSEKGVFTEFTIILPIQHKM